MKIKKNFLVFYEFNDFFFSVHRKHVSQLRKLLLIKRNWKKNEFEMEINY